jgi:hypothetical protein
MREHLPRQRTQADTFSLKAGGDFDEERGEHRAVLAEAEAAKPPGARVRQIQAAEEGFDVAAPQNSLFPRTSNRQAAPSQPTKGICHPALAIPVHPFHAGLAAIAQGAPQNAPDVT